MTTSELIELLSKFPPDTKVLLAEELSWDEFSPEEVRYEKAYHVWHSDYDGRKDSAYTCFNTVPNDGVYPRDGNKPDYIEKTVGEEFVVSIGFY